MSRLKKLGRKIAVAAVGFPVVILGLILIPLPGPGLLVTLAGLFILAIEFEWAQRHKERVKNSLSKVIKKSQDKYRKSIAEGKNPPKNT